MRGQLRSLLVALALVAIVPMPSIAGAKAAKAAKGGKAKRPEKPAKAEKKADDEPKAASEAKASSGTPEEGALKRGERVEFDARLIQGQTAKAGAVYLFERMSSDLTSMVKERSSYRDEIVETVFVNGEGAP